MKLRDFGLLTDQNLHPQVVAFLRATGFDILDVNAQGLQGTSDVDLLKRAVAENRLMVSHDADFGALAIMQGEPVVGLVYLRPGHIDPQFTIDSLQAILNADPDVTPPFSLVAKRTDGYVSIRIRQIT